METYCEAVGRRIGGDNDPGRNGHRPGELLWVV